MRDGEIVVPSAVGWVGRGEAFADGEVFMVRSQGVIEAALL
jgi:hypothetical protein